MNHPTTRVFDLPDRLRAKDDPDLIAADERHFAAVAVCLDESVAELTARIDAQRTALGDSSTETVERDMTIHRLTGRRRALRRFGLDLVLGHMVAADGSPPVYVGRFGLTDSTGERLVIDWRSPAAEPFFGATHARPMGLSGRRRYRWTRGRITDYWDEVFVDGGGPTAALDDQSAFVASLGSSRTTQMRDVLGTIQAEQDAIIRAGSNGALVVDGGPGTGKTVVALHRAAYLLYADPRLRRRRDGVLIVGPHQAYLSYVADVLPSLGEEGVQTCTLRDLVAEGADAVPEPDPVVARLKSTRELVGAVETAVRFYEEPPRTPTTIDTPWGETTVTPAQWAEAFGAAESGIAHNDARELVWAELLRLVAGTFDDKVPADRLRQALVQHRELRAAMTTAWPLLQATDLVGDLWTVPAYLRMCAPWLTRDEVHTLQRRDSQAWTVEDLPLLDAARQRLGDPAASGRRSRREAAVEAERAEMSKVIDDLIRSNVHDDGEGVMTMLRGEDMKVALVDDAALPTTDPDLLAGPFAHIVVDEAQELTDAQWQMLLLRCPSRSFTVVGDRAQARHGFTESWEERLTRIGLNRVDLASLTVNYRTPAEIMAAAEPVIRAAVPDANVPTSIRTSGVPVRYGDVSELTPLLDGWLAEHADGIACVIGAAGFTGSPRVRSSTPELSKGLEFDLVVLIDPDAFGDGVEGAVDRYVAMTRATQQLVVLRSR